MSFNAALQHSYNTSGEPILRAYTMINREGTRITYVRGEEDEHGNFTWAIDSRKKKLPAVINYRRFR